MSNSIWRDNKGYVQATILLLFTIMIAYMVFLFVMPLHDTLIDLYKPIVEDNQFYSEILEDRMDMAGRLGWKAPIYFVTIGFVYVILRTIKKQKYTRYEEEY